MQDMSLELEVLKSQEPEHHFFPAASEMLLDPLNWRHFFHMNCDGKVLCMVSEPDSDPTVMERRESHSHTNICLKKVEKYTHIYVSCIFCLYYAFSEEEIPVYQNTGYFSVWRLLCFLNFSRYRELLSVFLLNIYCPLAAESSFSTASSISLLPILPKFKATG